MVEAVPHGPAAAPLELLDAIFRRGRWARSADSPNAAGKANHGKGAGANSARGESIRKYALAALDNQVRKVECAGPGTRNSTLNDASLSLGHLVGAGALAESMVCAALEAAAHACGLVKDDGIASVRNTITSGLRAGMAQPADLSKIGQRTKSRRNAPSGVGSPSNEGHGRVDADGDRAGGDRGRGDGDGDGADGDRGRGDGDGGGAAAETESLDRRLAGFPLTDLGNAERFVARFGHRFKFCSVIGWLAWDGKRWSPEMAEAAVSRAVHDVVRRIKLEAEAIAGTADDYEIGKDGQRRSDAVAAWCFTSQSSRHFQCIAKTAASYLEVPASAFDGDPMKLNVANGTLVVRKSDDDSDYITLKPHDSADLITKIIPVAFDPAARCPQYDEFLALVQPQEAARRFLHQWGGLSLTGDISEQKLVVFWGQGKNGKSTLLETWSSVAGEYSKSCPIETFLDSKRARRGGEPTPDLAMLAGVRFLRTSEPERGAKLAEALIKLVTGGDAMQVRHLNKDFFELKPQFKLTVSGNHRPHIGGADEGIWRRVVLVPWTVTIPEEQRDLHMVAKLRAEGAGILNRLLDGLRDWLDNRLTLPEEVVAATAAYRTDSDQLGRFLAACVVTSPGNKLQSSILHQIFIAWAKVNDATEWSANGFAQAMTERGYLKKRSDVVWWRDIALNETGESFKIRAMRDDPGP